MLTSVNVGGKRYVTAARRVLTSSGSDGITMRAVAEEAATTATAIYRHFTDKDALLDALHREVFADFKGRILEASERKFFTARARLTAVLEAYREFGIDDPAGFSLLFLEAHGIRTSRYPGDYRDQPSSTFRVLVGAVEGCMEEGSLAPGDPVDVALTVDALVLGLMLLHRSGRFRDDRDTFLQFFRAAIERLLTQELQ